MAMAMDDDSIRPSSLLTSRQVSERLGVGITGLHEIMRHDETYPAPYRYGAVLLHREDRVELWRQGYRKYRKLKNRPPGKS
jgi:hypothetical protein